MTARLEQELQAWQPLFGAFDCLLNAFGYWLDRHQFQTDILYRYNWNFYASDKSDIFGGSIPVTALMPFLERTYGISHEVISFADIPENEWVLLTLDTYDLPYIKEYAQTVHQLHFAWGRLQGAQVEVLDPYYKALETLPYELIQSTVSRMNALTYRLFTSEIPTGATEESRKPWVAEMDFVERYQVMGEKMLKRLESLLTVEGDMRADVQFRRYFSSFRSITRAREVFFSTLPAEPLQEQILKGWNTVQKNLLRMSITREKGFLLLENSLKRVIELEVQYIAQLVAVQI